MAVKEPVAGFAVAVVREDGRWQCSALDAGALTSLDAAICSIGNTLRKAAFKSRYSAATMASPPRNRRGKVRPGSTTSSAILAKRRSTGAVFGLLAVDDEFFVIVRPSPRGPSLLLSDAAAALDYDIAADVLDLLRADPPDEEDESIWPEGDLDILADLGLPGPELEVIAGEVDLYPDEQLQMIAQRCGFADELGTLLDEI